MPEKKEFIGWLTRRRKRLLISWVVLGAIAHAVMSIYPLRDRLPAGVSQFLESRLAVVPAVLHVITIAILVLAFLPDHMALTDRSRGVERARKAVRFIYNYWWVLWVTWFLFYGFLAIQFVQWNAAGPDGTLALSVIGNFFNNFQTAVLFALYYEFTEATIEPRDDGGFRRSSSTPWPSLIITILLLAGAELLVAKLDGWPKLLSLISGLGGGIAIALFVGRLDSKRIKPPRIVIAALYLYAVIQPIYGFMDERSSPYLGLTMFSLALVLKLLLFLLVYWAFVSGRLLYYCVRITELIQEGDTDFEKFLVDHVPRVDAPAPPAVEATASRPAGTSETTNGRRKVFLAVPMSSLEPDSTKTVRAGVLTVAEALRTKNVDVYCASALDPPYEPADQARIRTERELASADIVMLVYPSVLATSALVEVGMALALQKRCLLFVRHGVQLPFLLREIAHRPGCREQEFETYDDLREKVARHWDVYAHGTAAAR